jgi:uncharacterized coiled-coil DUF342 family protein
MISQKEFDDAMADLVKAEAEIDELRKIRDGCEKIMLGRKAEIERLRAELSQVRAMAQVMDENNWRDLSLRIQRQGVDGQLTKDGT